MRIAYRAERMVSEDHPNLMVHSTPVSFLHHTSWQVDGRLSRLIVTGVPVAHRLYEWVAARVSEDVRVISTSGGTDVVSSFAGGVPGPPILGVAVEACDMFPGVRRHGDRVTHTSRGTFVVHGRSDDLESERRAHRPRRPLSQARSHA